MGEQSTHSTKPCRISLYYAALRLKLAPIHMQNWSKVLVTQALVHKFNPQNPILKIEHDVTYILTIPALERERQVNFWDYWPAGIAYDEAPGQYIFIIHTYIHIYTYMYIWMLCLYACLCTTCLPRVTETRRGHQISLEFE